MFGAISYHFDGLRFSVLISMLCVIFTLTLLKLLHMYYFPYYIPDIPIIKANTLLGYSTAYTSAKDKYDSHEFMLKEAEKSGGIFQFYYVGRLIVMVNDSYLVKHVMDNVHGKGFFQRGDSSLTSGQILTLDTNDEWRKRRHAVRQTFAVSTLKKFQAEIKLFSDKMIKCFAKFADEGAVVEIDKIFANLALDVICKVAFQYDMEALDWSDQSQQLHDDIHERFKSAWVVFLPWIGYYYRRLPLPIFKQHAATGVKLKRFARKLIANLRDLESKGLMRKDTTGASLLELSKTEGITENQIEMEATVMLIAGHETTSHTLSWFIYSLCMHPEIQRKCQLAMDEATKSAVSSEDTEFVDQVTMKRTGGANLLPPYVEACLKESMRLYNTTIKGSMRLVNKKEGFTIPKDLLNKHVNMNKHGKTYTKDIHLPYNTWFHMYNGNIHRSTQNWGANAMEFIPERWLDNKLLSSPAIYGGGGIEPSETSFQPFSSGIRNCVGMNLALLEIRTVLADMLSNFTFTLADDTLRDPHLALETTQTMRPCNLLPVRITKRVK